MYRLQLSKRMNGSGWFLAKSFFSACLTSYNLLYGNSGVCKIWVLSSGTLFQTQDSENVATVYCRLSSTKVDAQCDKLATVIGRTKLTRLAPVDVRPITLVCLSC